MGFVSHPLRSSTTAFLFMSSSFPPPHSLPPLAMLSFYHPPTYALPILFLSLLQYHISEFLLAYIYSPEELSISSLLLSPPYITAMSFGLLEHRLSNHFLPNFHNTLIEYFHLPALFLLFFGESLRKAAWFTARSSFTHKIKSYRRQCHVLVHHGVYRYVRHPGYLGWFVWALATQLLLGNLISFVAFALVAWRFFEHRIRVEEFYLVRIFGEPYVKYREKTPTWIPGIN